MKTITVEVKMMNLQWECLLVKHNTCQKRKMTMLKYDDEEKKINTRMKMIKEKEQLRWEC